MSKRPHNAQAPATATEDLIERLKSAGNDIHLVRDLIETNDRASVAAAIVALLASRSSDSVDDAKRRKKTRNRRTPNETFLEILLFADRDTLDAMQLVGRFLFEMIRDREDKELALRSISRVNTGKCFRSWIVRSSWERHWRPMVENGSGLNTGKRFYASTINQLLRYLRLAGSCEFVCIDLQWDDAVSVKHRGAAYRALFGELVVPTMFVNVLTVCIDSRSAAEALRQLQSCCDLSFKLANVSSQIDSAGFEKYQRGDGRTWLVDDLEDHVMAEIKQTEKTIQVHIFSSF